MNKLDLPPFLPSHDSAHFQSLSPEEQSPLSQIRQEMEEITESRRREGVMMHHIGGNEFAKAHLTELFSAQEMMPSLEHVLVYGPPGVGKTMLAKALLNYSGKKAIWVDLNSLQYNHSHLSATQLMHHVFQEARLTTPSLVILDEMDHWLRKPGKSDSQETLAVKHELLNQMDSKQNAQVQVIMTSSQPWDLDGAALRRLPHKLFLPVPSYNDRLALLSLALAQHRSCLEHEQIVWLAQNTQEYTGSDIHQLANCASLSRHSQKQDLSFGPVQVNAELPAISYNEIVKALRSVKSSTSQSVVDQHLEFIQRQGISDQLFLASPTTSDSDHSTNRRLSFKRDSHDI